MDKNYNIITTERAVPSFQLSVRSEKPLGRNKVSELVSRVLEQSNAGQKLKIVENAQGVHYQWDDGDFLPLDLTHAPREIELKIIELADRKLPKRKLSIKAIYNRLVSMRAGKIPVVNALWHLVAAPVSLFIKMFRIKVSDISELKAFADTSKNLLPTALAWAQEIFPEDLKEDALAARGEAFTLKAQLAEAVSIAERQQKEDHKALAENLVETLLSRVTPENHGLTAMLIPTGYWDKGEFQPLMLAFSISEQGRLKLSLYRYGEQKENDLNEFEWEGEPSRESIAEVLKTLFELQFIEEREPSKRSMMDWMRLGLVSAELLRRGEGVAGMPELSRFDIERMASFIPKLLASAGGKPVPGTSERRHYVGSDPWKLLHETLRFQFPEQPLGDKFYFAYTLFVDRLKLVLKHYQRLSSEERKSWVMRLDKELHSLKREFLKSGAIDMEQLLKPMEKEIEALSFRLEAVSRISKKEHLRKLAPLQNVKKADSQAVVIMPKNQEVTQAEAALKPFAMTRADWALAKELGKAVDRGNFEAALHSMEQIVSRMDSLNEGDAFEECSLLFKMAMGECLQLDRLGRLDIFWKKLAKECLAKGDFTLMRSMSASFEKAMQQFTEAKLKLWQTPLIPEELAYLALVIKGTYTTFEEEHSWLLSRCGKNDGEDETIELSALKEKGFSYEEAARLFTPSGIDPFRFSGQKYKYYMKGAIPLLHNRRELHYMSDYGGIAAVSRGQGFSIAANSEGNTRYRKALSTAYFMNGNGSHRVAITDGDKPIKSYHELWKLFHGEKCERDNDSALVPAPVSAKQPVPPEKILRVNSQVCLAALLRPASLSKDASGIEALRAKIQARGRLTWEAESILGLPHHVKIKLSVGGKKVTNFYPLGPQFEDNIEPREAFYWNYGGALLGRPELRDKRRVGYAEMKVEEGFLGIDSQPIPVPKGSPLKVYAVMEEALLGEYLSDESNATPLESWRRDCIDVTGADWYANDQMSQVRVLEWMMQTPEKLSDLEVRRLLFTRAFHQPRATHTVFQTEAELDKSMQNEIQAAINRNDVRAALFMLTVCDRMRELYRLNVPHFNTHFQCNGEELTGFMWIERLAHDKSLPVDLQADAISAYLMVYVHGSIAFNDEIAPDLMALKVRLEMIRGALTLPFTYQTIDDWVKCTMLPRFLREEGVDKHDQLLNELLRERYPQVLGGVWKRNANLGIEVWECGNYAINLQTLQIIDRNHPTYSSKKQLPHELVSSEQFKKAFGAYSGLADEEVDISTGIVKYKFKNSTGDECEAILNPGQLLLKKKIADRWHLFSIPGDYDYKASLSRLKAELQRIKRLERGGLRGADQILNQKGVWIDQLDSKQAILNGSESDPIRVVFNKRGKVQKLLTKKGRTAIFGTQASLQKLFCPTEKNDLLFFNKGGLSAICTVRILSSNLEISEVKKGRWIVSSEGPYKGMEWKISGLHTPFGPLLKAIEPSLEQQAIVVRDGKKGESHLLLWTKPVDSKQTEPLKVTINDRGEIAGSPASLLLMSALLSSRGKYQQAKHFMEKAAKARLTSTKELELLNRARIQIEKCPERTGREIAYKIKALLLISRLQRMEGNSPSLVPGNEEEFVKRTEAIGKLYDSYQKRVSHAFHGRGKVAEEMVEEDLLLNASELREVRMLHRESLSVFKRAPEAFRSAPQETLPLREGISELVPPIMADIFLSMKKPSKQGLKVDALSNLTSSSFLKEHFFEIWNALIEHKLTPDKLRILFAPAEGIDFEEIPEQFLALLSGDFTKIEQFNMEEEDGDQALEVVKKAIKGDFFTVAMARRALLSLSSLSDEQKMAAKIDLETLYASRKKQPSTIFGIIKAGIKVVRDKPNANLDALHAVLGVMTASLANVADTITADGRAVDTPQSQFQASVRVVKRDQFGRQAPLFGEREEQFQALLEGNEEMSLQEFVQKGEKDLGVHAAEAIRGVELAKRLAVLESRLKVVEQRELSSGDFTVPVSREDPSLFAFWEEASLHAAIPGERVAGLKNALCVDDKSLADGLDEAVQTLNASQKFKSISPKRFKKFSEAYREEQKAAEKEAEKYRKEIFALLQTEGVQNALPSKLRRLINDPALAIEGEIFEQLMNSFQRMEFNYPELEKKITSYLLAKTEAQQLGARSSELLDQLHQLLKVKPKSKSVDYKEWELEWTLYSSELLKVYASGKERTRYLDESGKLINPRFTRKYLIAEYRSERILRKDQRDLIEKMERNPAEFYELKMGAGKTSMILPIVMNLLAENGEYPVLLIKEELLNQNMEDLDIFTRLLFEQAAVNFRFEVNQPISVAILQEQYLRLLEVKQDKGYIVSSVHAKAALEQALGLLTAQFSEEPTIELRKQIHILTKIRALLNGDEERFGFKTITLGDEIDDIFDSRKEDNLSQGAPQQLNPHICEALELILTALYASNDPNVIRLKNALARGTQAALKPGDLKEVILPALARAVAPLHAKYLMQPGAEPPAIHNENEKKVLGALKHLFQISLISCLQQDPGIDVGIKESNGYTVGPQQKGLEKSGYIFGDEFDVIANHYLQYAVKLPDNDFTKAALSELAEAYRDEYAALAVKAQENGLSLLEYLNLPENHEERIKFFHRAIRERNLIRRFPKQFNVKNQEVVFGTRLGGVTGTLNRYLMPLGQDVTTDGLLTDKSSSVEGEVLLRIGAGSPQTVDSASEEALLDKMAERLTDHTCKAIINEGASLKGVDALGVANHFASKGHKRTIVFIHPECADSRLSRKICLMSKPGDITAVTKEELNRHLRDPKFKRQVLFYFGPPDTRGTDFVIPPGYGLVVTGPTTSRESFQQAVARMRGLGEKHTVQFLVPQSVRERISSDKREIAWTDLYNDIKTRSIYEERALHHQAFIQSLTLHLTRGVKNCLYSVNDALDRGDFWKNEQQRNHEADHFRQFYKAVERQILPEKMTNLLADFEKTRELTLQEKLTELFQTFDNQLKTIASQMPKDHPFQPKIEEVVRSLHEERKRLMATLPLHQMRQPETFSSAATGMENTVAVVQEQQQVQQQQLTLAQVQQQQLQVGRVKARIAQEKFEYDQEGMLSAFQGLNYARASSPKLQNELKQCGFSADLYVSKHMAFMLNQVAQRNGTPLGTLILQNGQLMLLSQRDFSLGFREAEDATFIALVPGETHPQGYVILGHRGESGCVTTEEIKIVQMKWLLGYSKFSESERELLSTWIENLTQEQYRHLLTFTKANGTRDQLRLLDII